MTARSPSLEQDILPSPWANFDDSDVRALIAEYPLAWVQGGSGDEAEASLLPLIGTYDAQGRLTALIGHLARRNPLHARLAADPRATILFRGPDGYISPEHAGRRDWAPTWNYAQLRIRADVSFDAVTTEAALDVLTDAMEGDRPDPWHRDELGDRYPHLHKAIIGFRADVTDLRGTFKLGQDESREDYQSILAHHPDPVMRRWMQRLNRHRFA